MPEDLFSLAEKEKILVRFFSLPADLLGAYYHTSDKKPVIILHNKLKSNRKLLRCILAEELGHHFTTSYNLLAFARAGLYDRNKCEHKAIWWATKYLVPLNELIAAANSGLFSTWELAEHFNVTERFMWTSLRLYCEKNKTKMVKPKHMLSEFN